MNERLRSRRIWAAAAVTVVAAAALIVAVLALQGGELANTRDNVTVLQDKADWDEHRQDIAGHNLDARFQPWDRLTFRESAAREAESLIADKRMDTGSAQGLIDSAGSILDMYYTGDPAPFLDLYRRQGIEPVSELSDAQDLEWKTASVDGQRVDGQGIRLLRVTADNGMPHIDSLPGELIHRIVPSKPRGASDFDLTGSSLANVPVAGVVVPTTFLSTDGKPFNGLLVLYLARRDSDGAWLLIQIEARAVTRPEGAPEGRPPRIFILPI